MIDGLIAGRFVAKPEERAGRRVARRLKELEQLRALTRASLAQEASATEPASPASATGLGASRACADANESGHPTATPLRSHGIDLRGLPAALVDFVQRHGRLPPQVRVKCGGRRRRDGAPCEAPSVPGKRRCKWHGGCSTGPRTLEGKAKVAKNLQTHR